MRIYLLDKTYYKIYHVSHELNLEKNMNFEDPIYTTGHIVKGLKMPMERVRDWLRRGYFTPSIESPGQGKKAFFSLTDICLAELFRYLVEDKGVKRKIAHDLIRSIDGHPFPLGFSNYLVFETFNENGEKVPRFNFVQGLEELKLTFSPDKIEVGRPDYDEDLQPDFDDGEDQPEKEIQGIWEDVLVINLRKLRERVLIAVAAVE